MPRPPVSRRAFLEQLAIVGGTGLLMAGMDAFGMGIASASELPPTLQGGGAGKTVVILGAGLAGMTAAYELAKAGYKVQVLEARSFAGGRCQTARKGFTLTELGGTKQDCSFDDGLYINHGPWRIPYHHRSTLHYTKLFGVPLEVMVNDNDHSYVFMEKTAGPLAGKPVRKGEIAADIRGSAAEMLAKVVNQGSLDKAMTAEDKALFLEYLTHEGYLTKDLAYEGTENRGYSVEPSAGLQPGVPLKPHAFTDVLHSKTWRTLSSIANYEQQRTMFQPTGGMDQIAKGFEKAVGPMISYSTVVDKIAQSDAGVEVMATKDGKPITVKADYCLCTIPLSVLKGLDLAVSDTFKTAMEAAAYAPVGKIGLQMKRRFWEEDDHIYGGHIQTDNPDINSITFPSTGWQSNKGVLLGYYNFGSTAAKISALSPNARAVMATDFGKKIFPDYQSAMESHFSVAWHLVEYNLGGWANWSAEARADAYPTLLEPDGRIYLAGEHLSYIGGWQAGGIESAWAQIAKIHQRATAA